jgi:hypothetical protein
METYWSPVYFTSYKTESTRREKFEAVGVTMNGASVKAVREDVAAKIREELADIEKQRQQWEQEQTVKAAGKAAEGEAATKATDRHTDTREAEGVDLTAAPAEGLRLIEIAGGVAVVADDWKTTYFNKKAIKAHGAKWNKERKQWEATDPQDVDALRAWFFFHDRPTDQGATIDGVTTEDENEPTAAEPQSEPQAAQANEQPAANLSPLVEAVADLLQTFGEIMQQAAKFEGVTIPAATLERWQQETTNGTTTAAARFAEVCACLGCLTPDSRQQFDGLGVIFWTLAEQLRNGYDPATIKPAADYARGQLFDLIDRTQTENQARALRDALSEAA